MKTNRKFIFFTFYVVIILSLILTEERAINAGDICVEQKEEQQPHTYTIDWSHAETNGWKNPLGEETVLWTSSAYDFDSPLYYNNWNKSHHTGVDIHREEGEPVYAIAPGKVVKVVPNPNDNTNDPMGMVVVIQHEGNDNTGRKQNFFAVYGHVKAEACIVEKTCVDAGQRIGTIKKAGSPSHLHFGINTSSELGDFLRPNKGLGWGRTPYNIAPVKVGWVNPIDDYLSKIYATNTIGWKDYKLGDLSYYVSSDFTLSSKGDFGQYQSSPSGIPSGGFQRSYLSKEKQMLFNITVMDVDPQIDWRRVRFIHYDECKGKRIEEPVMESQRTIIITHMGCLVDSFKTEVAGYPVTVWILKVEGPGGVSSHYWTFTLRRGGKWYSFDFMWSAPDADPECSREMEIFRQLICRICFPS